ncbi:NAD(P)/FAD-dependent oxidoreductase [Paraburkholderia diazotrophica]|uniref:D-amino-acid dehydrogenase n=1 Tax=Paraburkholderia diazotrophica TaxID=667676 RepID=A0A1H6YXL9_9BURK|nr:FAD-binding oxidoreductase [Paraburkholderia diazotrophica]SEJ45136.1 D-amino-acid dehydrogenase [Paraburkholderia diazotrophica]
MKFDTVVLGAGMVGVSVAVHLQQRGLSVALVDRKAPGNETSFGNAGLIQREGVYPYAFPRDPATLLRYARNRSLDVRYHPRAMPKLLPFLYRYWYHSRADRHAAIARSYSTLIEHCVSEHRALIAASGAQELLRTGGWLKVFRSARKQDSELRQVERWSAEYGVAFEALDAARLRREEPSLSHALLGALRYTDADSISDPNALVTAYARYFEQLGGRIFIGDAMTLEPHWSVNTEAGRIDAHSAVVALGPWSDTVSARLGYRLPLAVKRGYHMHYSTVNGARLKQPVLDTEIGYMITPMARGIRLTTGAELATCDAPATPVQLDAIEPIARRTFPLGARLDERPWLGRRPCTPDMMPIIGPAKRHKELWFAFGHAHHGLTLGPITGRLLAEMMVGAEPVADPFPFRVDRF